jgi:hypothetical protein
LEAAFAASVALATSRCFWPRCLDLGDLSPMMSSYSTFGSRSSHCSQNVSAILAGPIRSSARACNERGRMARTGPSHGYCPFLARFARASLSRLGALRTVREVR